MDPLSVYSRYGLHARQVAQATLYTGGSNGFVTSAAAPIATEWSEPVLGRDFHPQLISACHGAGVNGMLRKLWGRSLLDNLAGQWRPIFQRHRCLIGSRFVPFVT